MVVYSGSIDDTHELIQFFRANAAKMRNLRRIVISPEKTVVKDVNADSLEFPGLTYGSMVLEELLRELGVVFVAATLHNPKATPKGIKEFDLSGRWTWGHDRIL